MSDYWGHETNDDLVFIERGDGWWLEDEAYRAPISGPYKTRADAQAAKEREVARRIASIATEKRADAP